MQISYNFKFFDNWPVQMLCILDCFETNIPDMNGFNLQLYQE